jgi:hypothetical protein
MVAQRSVAENKRVDHLIARAAAKKLLPVPGKFESVKRFFNPGPGTDGTGLQVNDRDFVFAVAAVQHGGEAVAGMNGHINRKIPEHDLLTHRPQRPLVREQN